MREITLLAVSLLLLLGGHVVADLTRWYETWFGTDLVLHAVGGAIGAYAWILWIRWIRGEYRLWFTGLTAVLFAVFSAYLWEVGQYLFWEYVPSVTRYHSDLRDTLWDIGMHAAGAIVFVLAGSVRRKSEFLK